MALISTKNVAAPFTNKTNLITLILILVAFLFLRLSGGEVDLVNTKDSPRKPASNTGSADIYDSSDHQSLEDIENLFQ